MDCPHEKVDKDHLKHNKACNLNIACVKVCAGVKWDRLNAGPAVRALLWGSAGSRVRSACLSVIKAVVTEAASDGGRSVPTEKLLSTPGRTSIHTMVSLC
ncbi:hypothetical protein MHYP_G00359190 [Metynnis hypsauchen]